MTANRNFKRRVRARAARTGESYTSALRHLSDTRSGDPMSDPIHFRLAVAQTTLRGDPSQPDELRDSGAEIRRLMRQAHDDGARLVHFAEGATTWPDKRLLSSTGPDDIGPADWDRLRWNVLAAELEAIAALAGELRLWTVVGAPHRLTPPHRPHNSLYVIADTGTVVTRYDERMISNTKLLHLYAPGSEPVTFEVDGVRFGCALGMEVHFPEVFLEYERLDVDCVLFSTVAWTMPGSEPAPQGADVFAAEARAHAATNSYWVSYADTAQGAVHAPSGVISPDGRWLARGPQAAVPAVVVAVLDGSAENLARPWRRKVRAGIYDPHLVDDPRSEDRATF
jgi:predicted amidohydrolase